MWLALKALLIRWALGKSFGSLLSLMLFLGIPLAGVLKVLATRIAAPAVRRWTGATQAPTTVEEAMDEARGA